MSLKDYPYRGGDLVVTEEMKKDFQELGYVLIRKLLDAEEVAKVKDALEGTADISKNAIRIDDGASRTYKLCLWNHPGNDVAGMIARSQKVAGTAEQLLGGEVYHYHTKLMMKEAGGGRHAWHQDYGYWYKNGNLRPDMLTAFVALDRCCKENGCLQILSGSHHCGRVDHGGVGQAMGADLERVKHLQAVLPHLYVELEPGDAIFFHCNVLHTSSANTSDMRRWALLHAYNRADNNPVYEHHHPQYTPLVMVDNSAIKACPVSWDGVDHKWMLTKERHQAGIKNSPSDQLHK